MQNQNERPLGGCAVYVYQLTAEVKHTTYNRGEIDVIR
jgi:hypothetical protein